MPTGFAGLSVPAKMTSFHFGAAQGAGGLPVAQHPADGVAGRFGLAAAIRPYDGGDSIPLEAEFGLVAKRLEPLQFDFFQLEQTVPRFTLQ